jgi:hypothetical protein
MTCVIRGEVFPQLRLGFFARGCGKLAADCCFHHKNAAIAVGKSFHVVLKVEEE